MIEREIGPTVLRLADQYPVVTITGPRQSGKTTLCRSLFPEKKYFNLEDLDTRQLAISDPREFLQRAKTGAVLDEIQKAPDLVSYIQGIVDKENITGQFILTGSEQFELSQSISQSLAGRTALLRLLPFSYSELFGDRKAKSMESLLFKGFYPRIHQEKLNPTEALSFYVSTYVERDVRSLKNISNLFQFEAFLKLCAANIGQELNQSRLANDIGVDHKTISSWLSVLQASYIVLLLPPHFKNFRKRVTKSPKLYFYDVGLASFLLGVKHEEQLQHHAMRGNLFENMVVCELLKNRFNRVEENNLFFYRDSKGHEVDVIIDRGDQYDIVEIKSSRTYAKDFMRGIDYYGKINPAIRNRFLIYSGDEEQTIGSVQLRSYNHIGDI